MAFKFNPFTGNLDLVISKPPNFTYITNPDFEVDTTGWNLYNDQGRTNPAFVIDQDITYTSALAGSAGNGVQIEYIYNAGFPSSTPNINVISGTHVQVRWNNGPTIANNPTSAQIITAWNLVPAAVAIATLVNTGSPTKLQYINGSLFLGHGGDTSPVDGTGGVVTGVTFTRNTLTPLIGVGSGDLGKDAANREGMGVSTDFSINTIDNSRILQIDFIYQGSTNMVLGANSDVRVFVYDIGNATLIPISAVGDALPGPVNTPKTFSGQFLSSNSLNYRLILHISTTNALAWDLLIDSVEVSDTLNATAVTQTESLVLPNQPISGAVTDHMCVMWRDGATQWVPATIAGAAIPVFGSDVTQLGFATNIVGGEADIFIRGYMDGWSFGPFLGYDQYIDNVTGGISPLPSPFTDTYVRVGKAIADTVLNVQFDIHVDLISNGSGVPIKGGLLSSSAVNDGTGDLVLSPGANGNALIANSAATLGINWAPAVVVASPFTYTTSTRTLAFASQTANFFLAAPNGGAGVPSFRAIVAADIPTLNQNTTGSAAKWTTARLLAGNSVDGSANVPFANKFIVQGTVDAGLSGAQFLGALGTGIVKNTTTTGVLSIAVAGDFPTLNQNTTGSAAKWTTARLLAGNSVDGSADVPFSNKFIVQGTADTGLTGAQFLGALTTGIVKNTTTTGVLSIAVAGDFPTLNQNTTGSAAKWTTARLLAGNSVDGSANVPFANKFIVQGTADAGLSGAQFLGALATGLVKNTTTTGVLSIAGASDVTGALLTGFTLTIGGGTVAATDSILQGIQKMIGEPQVKTGANGKIGTAVLVAGTVTVANTSVTANSRIFLTSNVDGGTPGWLRVSAKTVATSFVITSSSILDTSTVAWIIVESIP